jgi:CRP-like cAMP-binding protein
MLIQVDDKADRFFIILHGSVAIYKSRDKSDLDRETALLIKMKEALSWRVTIKTTGPIKLAHLLPDESEYCPHILGIEDKNILVYEPSFLERELKYFKKADLNESSRMFDPSTGVLLFTCIAILGAGTIFGEKGLEESTPRTATVVCVTDCDFSYVLKVDYDLSLREIYRADTERRKTYFTKNIFKNSITGQIALRLSQDFYRQKTVVPRGFLLRQQGVRGKDIYVLRQGQAVVERTAILNLPVKGLQDFGSVARNKRDEKTFVLSFLGDGELMGEEVLFSTGPSDYTIKIYSDEATVMKVTIECLKSYFKLDHNVGEFLRGLHEIRIFQWENLFIKMQERDKLVHNYATPLQNPRAIPLMAQPVTDLMSFEKKYDGDIAAFLIKEVNYRLPNLVTVNDAETIVPYKPENPENIWSYRELNADHYHQQDISLKELNKQSNELKNRRQRFVVEKFNQVLRDQIAKSARSVCRSTLQDTKRSSVLNLSIVGNLAKKVDHTRTLLRTFRKEQETSLLCFSRDTLPKLESKTEGAKSRWKSKSVASVCNSSGLDNLVDLTNFGSRGQHSSSNNSIILDSDYIKESDLKGDLSGKPLTNISNQNKGTVEQRYNRLLRVPFRTIKPVT